MLYKTKKGDTWDALALSFWGNEYLMGELVTANPFHRNTIVFDEGVVLVVPEIEVDDDDDAPDWLQDEEFLDDDGLEESEDDSSGVDELESW